MRVLKRIMKVLVPVSVLVLGLGVVVYYETSLRYKIDTVPVVVAKEDVNFKDKITSEDLEIKNIRAQDVVSDSYKEADVNLVLDKFAGVDISQGTQIYPSLIDTYNLIPDESKGEFIAPIPNDWLFAVPGSLRKTFVADFYAVPDEDQKVVQSLIEQSEENEEKNEEDEPLETNENADKAVTGGMKPILENVRVSSVKDSSNSEVTKSEEGENIATGVISNIEIISDQAMLDQMTEAVEKGYLIYVVYKYEANGVDAE